MNKIIFLIFIVFVSGCSERIVSDPNNGIKINSFEVSPQNADYFDEVFFDVVFENVGGTTAEEVNVILLGIKDSWKKSVAFDDTVLYEVSESGKILRPSLQSENRPGDLELLQKSFYPPFVPKGVENKFPVTARVIYTYATTGTLVIPVVAKTLHENKPSSETVKVTNTGAPLQIALRSGPEKVVLDDVICRNLVNSCEQEETYILEFVNVGDGLLLSSQARSNLAFHNPENLKNGIIQIINNGKFDTNGFVSFEVKEDNKVLLSSLTKSGGERLSPGQISQERNINYLLRESGEYILKINYDCQVNEITMRDNNYKLVVENGKVTRIIPLELSDSDHCGSNVEQTFNEGSVLTGTIKILGNANFVECIGRRSGKEITFNDGHVDFTKLRADGRFPIPCKIQFNRNIEPTDSTTVTITIEMRYKYFVEETKIVNVIGSYNVEDLERDTKTVPVCGGQNQICCSGNECSPGFSCVQEENEITGVIHICVREVTSPEEPTPTEALICEQPQNFRITNQFSNEDGYHVNYSWDPPTNGLDVTEYRTEWRELETDWVTRDDKVDPSTHSYTVVPLDLSEYGGRTFQNRVYAVCDEIVSEPSNSEEFTYPTEPEPTPTPIPETILLSTNVGDSFVSLIQSQRYGPDRIPAFLGQNFKSERDFILTKILLYVGKNNNPKRLIVRIMDGNDEKVNRTLGSILNPSGEWEIIRFDLDRRGQLLTKMIELNADKTYQLRVQCGQCNISNSFRWFFADRDYYEEGGSFKFHGRSQLYDKDFAFKIYGRILNAKPTFEDEEIILSFNENSQDGVNVGRVTATDPDNDKLTYSLTGPDADNFTIDSNTGQIKTKSGIDYDYELQKANNEEEYNVTVEVIDNVNKYYESNDEIDNSIEIKIIINNVNEPPTFHFGGPDYPDDEIVGYLRKDNINFNRVEPIKFSLDSNIFRIFTRDPENDDLIVSLLLEHDYELFYYIDNQIKTRNGIIYDFENRDEYIVIAKVTDGIYEDRITVKIRPAE